MTNLQIEISAADRERLRVIEASRADKMAGA